MRVGRPAANLYNLRVTYTGRTVAQLIARDPPQALGSFLTVLAGGPRLLIPMRPSGPAHWGFWPLGERP